MPRKKKRKDMPPRGEGGRFLPVEVKKERRSEEGGKPTTKPIVVKGRGSKAGGAIPKLEDVGGAVRSVLLPILASEAGSAIQAASKKAAPIAKAIPAKAVPAVERAGAVLGKVLLAIGVPAETALSLSGPQGVLIALLIALSVAELAGVVSALYAVNKFVTAYAENRLLDVETGRPVDRKRLVAVCALTLALGTPRAAVFAAKAAAAIVGSVLGQRIAGPGKTQVTLDALQAKAGGVRIA